MANELGEFLRARRGRLGPEDVGLPAGLGSRRTPGLRLDAEERAHLYALAHQAAGRVAGPAPGGSRQVRPGVVQLLQTLRPYPAYVLSRTSDVLAANPEALALYA